MSTKSSWRICFSFTDDTKAYTGYLLVRNVLSQLKAAGIVTARQGSGGGKDIIWYIIRGFFVDIKIRPSKKGGLLMYGGADENRTRVRKQIPANFYGCSLLSRLSPIPSDTASRHAVFFGSLKYIHRSQACPMHVHHWSTPWPKPWSSKVRRALT